MVLFGLFHVCGSAAFEPVMTQKRVDADEIDGERRAHEKRNTSEGDFTCKETIKAIRCEPRTHAQKKEVQQKGHSLQSTPRLARQSGSASQRADA